MAEINNYKDDELVTLREAARILNVSESTFARYRDDGKISYYSYSKRKFLYKVCDLKKFFDNSYNSTSDYEE